MATTFSTPPPPSSPHTPHTPKHGAWQDYESFSPRKSSRVALQRSQRAKQTPPPTFGRNNLSSPPSTIKHNNKVASTSMSTPVSGKNNTKISIGNNSRGVSHALMDDPMAPTDSGLHQKDESNQSITTLRSASILPTPAKTPDKRPSTFGPAISTIARNLFAPRPASFDEVMPSTKGRKKNNGFTLGNLGTDDEDTAAIQIFTDSHDRVPEIDLNADNPFYGGFSAAIPEPLKRASKRRKIAIPGEASQTIEEAEKRTDGLVYVFRGKKMFRKFPDADEAEHTQSASDAELEAELEATVPSRLHGRVTRASIKPRLLFPTAEQIAAKANKSSSTDDEEAVTDIEECSTPSKATHNFDSTPKAPKFAPASPPASARVTRYGKKLDRLESPTHVTDDEFKGHQGKISPFDGWQRTKNTNQSSKRGADMIMNTGGDIIKRQRRGH